MSIPFSLIAFSRAAVMTAAYPTVVTLDISSGFRFPALSSFAAGSSMGMVKKVWRKAGRPALKMEISSAARAPMASMIAAIP